MQDQYIRIYFNENIVNELNLMHNHIFFEVPFSNNFVVTCKMPKATQLENLPYLSAIETFCSQSGYKFIQPLELVNLNINNGSDIDASTVIEPVNFKYNINLHADFKIEITKEENNSGLLSINLLHESVTKKFVYQGHDSTLFYLEPYKQGIGVVFRNYYDYSSQTENKPRYECKIYKSIQEIDYKYKEIIYLRDIESIKDYDVILDKMIYHRHQNHGTTKWHDQMLKSYKY